MVVDEIDVVHVAVLKSEGDPSVAGDRNDPRSSSVSSEWMQSVSWEVEVARFAGSIQVRQREGDSVQLVGGYPPRVVSLVEPSQPSMAKRTDHEVIIPRTGTVIKGFDGGGGGIRTRTASHMLLRHARLPFRHSLDVSMVLAAPTPLDSHLLGNDGLSRDDGCGALG